MVVRNDTGCPWQDQGMGVTHGCIDAVRWTQVVVRSQKVKEQGHDENVGAI